MELVRVGLAWNPSRGRRRLGRLRPPVDLDLAAILLAGGDPVEVVYHEHLTSNDGAVRLLGDSIDGSAPGDDETITADLTRIDDSITEIAILVTCSSGQTFGEIIDAHCRILDAAGAEITDCPLAPATATGMVVGSFIRMADWGFREIAAAVSATHPVEALPQLPNLLA
ncbi:MAG: TerD family protein [Nocardia sp.]|nr:TerD family protein [Nocardia sp.]